MLNYRDINTGHKDGFYVACHIVLVLVSNFFVHVFFTNKLNGIVPIIK